MSRRFERVLAPLRDGIRDDRASVLVIVATAAVGFGLISTVEPLTRVHTDGPALAVPAVPAGEVLIRWTESARTPEAVQSAAVAELLAVVLGIAWAAVALGAITITARSIARASLRIGELAIRRAVGASRRNIRVVFTLEAGLCAGAGLIAGGLLALIVGPIAASAWPGITRPGFPWSAGAALAIAAVIVLAELLAPGLARTRNLADAEEGQVNLNIPVYQLGCSLAVILAGAALLRGPEPSSPATTLDRSHVIVQLDTGVTEPSIRAERFGRLLQTLSSGDSVSSAVLTAPGDLSRLGMQDIVTTDCGRCSRAGIFIRYIPVTAVYRFVSPDSFTAGALPIVSGRGFTAADRWGTERVAVVNRHLALRHFQNGQPVGRDLFLGGEWPKVPYRVVGIVDDAPAAVLGGARQPREVVYLSVLQVPPRFVELQLPERTVPEADTIIAATLGGVLRTGPDRPASEWHAVQARMSAWFGGWFIGAGVIVLLVGVAGTFGIVGMWVRSLEFEIGVRRALGATRLSVLRSILVRAAGIGIGGTAVGLFLFFVVVREILKGQLVRVPAWNGPVVWGTALLLTLVALLAAWRPASRLVRKSPAG
jgi:hypothetical protein